MDLWVTDPKTKLKSVSLTMLVVSFLGCITGGALQIAGKVNNVSIFLELFYGAAALYFGRRITVRGQAYASEPTDGSKENG